MKKEKPIEVDSESDDLAFDSSSSCEITDTVQETTGNEREEENFGTGIVLER